MSNINLLGLAKKAGKACCGSRLCEKAVKEGKAKLVIIAADASEQTKKAISDCCKYYKVTYKETSDKESIGHITGTGVCSCVAITDKGFADGLQKKVE
ncbi:MAG: ribosomal L7Ae/L30e/S12e/Gadd45 family protein [Firmicutes bacterium]|nr:ribosomal L7Ae/L30e/S12e/Gadd45 family protein [Bacillota bacterium]